MGFIDFIVIIGKSVWQSNDIELFGVALRVANGSETLKNGIFKQNYVEAVVRKSSRVQMLAEIDHFEISSRV